MSGIAFDFITVSVVSDALGWKYAINTIIGTSSPSCYSFEEEARVVDATFDLEDAYEVVCIVDPEENSITFNAFFLSCYYFSISSSLSSIYNWYTSYSFTLIF